MGTCYGREQDEEAVELLQMLFPDRKVVGVLTRDIVLGGGNIHCITQQVCPLRSLIKRRMGVCVLAHATRAKSRGVLTGRWPRRVARPQIPASEPDAFF